MWRTGEANCSSVVPPEDHGVSMSFSGAAFSKAARVMNPFRSALRTTAVAAALAVASAAAQAPLDIRVALIIGNSAYVGAPALENPANDARSMSEVLRGLGFQVVELRDGNKAQMTAALAKVQESLKGKQGVGMLYYAGHGLQLDWHNYMVPVDARLNSAADVPNQAIDLGSVMDTFRGAGTRINILVMDACRDNPFTSSTSSAKGLAQVDAPPGTFLAYATAPGNVAEDGDAKSGNGLYTQYLLQELKKPITKIEDVFKRVRFNVRKQSQGRQIPWESTSLEDDFYFNDGVKFTIRPPVAAPAEEVAAVSVPAKELKPESKGTKEQQRETAFNLEKADWDRIKDSKNADDFYAFLLKYPSGNISEQAQLRVESLQRAKTVAVANRDGIVPLAAGARRSQLGDQHVVDLIDGFTKVRRRVTRTVTFADDSRFELDNGVEVYEQTGVLLKNRFGTKSPGILGAPADMAVGKKWRSAFQNLRPDGVLETNYWDNHVVGYDTITVPEGTFKCFLVVSRGQASFPGGLTNMEARSWFDPLTLRRLRAERINRNNGRITENSIVESVSFKRGVG